MAKQVLTVITDDIDGSKGAQTVSFALEGTEYTVDLNTRNLKKLRDVLGPYIEAGEKVSRSRRSSKRGSASTAGKSSSAEIRAWARDNGMDVPNRGRIPQAVADAWEAANSRSGPPRS